MGKHMKRKKSIEAILELVRGSPGLEPEQKRRLEKHVRALRHALRVRDDRLVHKAIERIAQEVVTAFD